MPGFGLIHDLTDIEYKVRRHLQSASSDLHNLASALDLEDADMTTEQKLNLAKRLVASAQESLRLVYGQ